MLERSIGLGIDDGVGLHAGEFVIPSAQKWQSNFNFLSYDLDYHK